MEQPETNDNDLGWSLSTKADGVWLRLSEPSEMINLGPQGPVRAALRAWMDASEQR